jgi:hypothetical protein
MRFSPPLNINPVALSRNHRNLIIERHQHFGRVSMFEWIGIPSAMGTGSLWQLSL